MAEEYLWDLLEKQEISTEALNQINLTCAMCNTRIVKIESYKNPIWPGKSIIKAYCHGSYDPIHWDWSDLRYLLNKSGKDVLEGKCFPIKQLGE